MTKSDLSERRGVFNSSVELGTRASLILTSLSGHELDLDQLVFFDYALLYSGEFSGPENLHPAVPNHIAEIVHRREYLPKALHLFLSRGLISVKTTGEGIYYYASEDTSQFVRCLKSGYYKRMWGTLFWIEENYHVLNAQRFGVLRQLGAEK